MKALKGYKGLYRHENGYWYIRIQWNGRIIQNSLQTKTVKFAIERYNRFMDLVISDKLTGTNSILKKKIEKDKNIKISQSVRDYIVYEKEKGISIGRIRSLKSVIKFILPIDVHLNKLDQNFIDQITSSMKHLTPNTQKQFISYIKSALNYQIRKGNLEEKFIAALEWPKISATKKSESVLITEVEYKKILEYLMKKNDVTNIMYIKLMRNAGLRPSEALAVRVSDINFKERYLSVQQNKITKSTDKSLKKIVITSDFINELRKYTNNMSSDEYLIKGRQKKYANGKTRSDNWLRENIVSICKIVGISKHSLYDFRHTAANEWAKKTGGNLRFVQQQLGHSSLTTTELYLHDTISDNREILDNAFKGDS